MGIWATEWQDSHVRGADWSSCYSTHSQALNINRKAYAAWWLWARQAGWPGTGGIQAGDGNGDGTDSIVDTFWHCRFQQAEIHLESIPKAMEITMEISA